MGQRDVAAGTAAFLTLLLQAAAPTYHRGEGEEAQLKLLKMEPSSHSECKHFWTLRLFKT